MAGMLVLLGVFVGVVYASTEVPSPDSISNAQTTIIYYSDGTTEMARLGDENRTNVTLDQIAEPAQHAVLAAENRELLHRPGHLLHRHHPGDLEQRDRRLDPGRLHDHPAVREERDPAELRPDVQPQVPGAVPGDQAGQQLLEGPDPRELPQHHLLRPRRLRHRGGGQHLLRGPGRAADRPAGRGARRPHPEPLALRPGGQPRGRPGPLGPGARRDGRGGLDDRRRSARRRCTRRCSRRPARRWACRPGPRASSSTASSTRCENKHGYDEQQIRAGGLRITTTVDKGCRTPRWPRSTRSWRASTEVLREALVAVDPQTGAVRAYYGGAIGHRTSTTPGRSASPVRRSSPTCWRRRWSTASASPPGGTAARRRPSPTARTGRCATPAAPPAPPAR